MHKENVDILTNWINDFFQHMFRLFPSCLNIFKSTGEINLTKVAWVRGFMEADIVVRNDEGLVEIKLELLERGKKSLVFLNQQFMPSCGQFIHLCLNGLEIESKSLA